MREETLQRKLEDLRTRVRTCEEICNYLYEAVNEVLGSRVTGQSIAVENALARVRRRLD